MASCAWALSVHNSCTVVSGDEKITPAESVLRSAFLVKYVTAVQGSPGSLAELNGVHVRHLDRAMGLGILAGDTGPHQANALCRLASCMLNVGPLPRRAPFPPCTTRMLW